MSLSAKTNLLVTRYARRQYPELEEGVRKYITDELQRVEQSITSLSEASIQVALCTGGQFK